MKLKYSVTGVTNLSKEQATRVINVVSLLHHPAAIATGGAHGVDTMAIYAAHKYHHQCPRPLYVPHGEFWNPVTVDWATEIIVVESPRASYSAYLARDDELAKFCDVLLAFPASPRALMRGSGTWATIRRARKLGLRIRFFPLDGSTEWNE